MEKSLKDSINQGYSIGQNVYKELQNIQPVDHPPDLSLDTSQQEEDEPLGKQEELHSLQLQTFDRATEVKLFTLQSTMEQMYTKVKVLMKHYEEVFTFTHVHSMQKQS